MQGLKVKIDCMGLVKVDTNLKYRPKGQIYYRLIFRAFKAIYLRKNVYFGIIGFVRCI